MQDLPCPTATAGNLQWYCSSPRNRTQKYSKGIFKFHLLYTWFCLTHIFYNSKPVDANDCMFLELQPVFWCLHMHTHTHIMDTHREWDRQDKHTFARLTWLANGLVAAWWSSNKAGATKLKPRNNSWAVALGGIPGESARNRINNSWLKNENKKGWCVRWWYRESIFSQKAIWNSFYSIHIQISKGT